MNRTDNEERDNCEKTIWLQGESPLIQDGANFLQYYFQQDVAVSNFADFLNWY